MTDLPPGWERVALGDLLLRIEAGKSFQCEPRPARAEEWGVIKVSSMTWGKFRENENKAIPVYKSVNSEYEIKQFDILVSRANTESYVGAPVLVGACRPRLLLSDKSLRLVPSANVDRQWLTYTLSAPTVRDEISRRATGTKDSMRNISQRALADICVPVPPLAEQRRIVAALEGHLSRLDVANRLVETVECRLKLLLKQSLLQAVRVPGPDHWKITRVDEAGRVDLGRQRHPDWHNGPHMRPYLRVANVFEDRLDTTDVMEMNFPPEVFDRYRLDEGDILLNEGQSPQYLGRAAMYRGHPKDVAFTNSILRFKAGHNVLPEWALLVFRRHMHAGRFLREVRITTNIAHLSAARLKSVEFPVPPMEEQRQIVAELGEKLHHIKRLGEVTSKVLERCAVLRKSLLSAAFAGSLVSQDRNDEPAFELLARIRADREAAKVARKPRRRMPPAGSGNGGLTRGKGTLL